MRSNETSLVSVVIINYNSKDFLRQSVASSLELDWPQLEVIVVDNNSTDGSADMVEAEFGSRVRLIRRKHNSPTAGRNEGFAAAKGKYILSLDNDIVLTDKSMASKAVPIFEQFPKVAVLAFKVGTVEKPEEPLPEHWWHPVPVGEGKNRFFFTDFFSEGAVFFRTDALRAAGGYDETLFQYYEGTDLTFKLLRDGHDMLYCPTLFCGELRVRGVLHRKRTYVNYLSVRNRIWILWKYYPFWRGLPYFVGRITLAGSRSAFHGWLDHFFKAVKDGILAPKAIRAQRRPLGKEVWEKVRQIHRGIFLDAEADENLRIA